MTFNDRDKALIWCGELNERMRYPNIVCTWSRDARIVEPERVSWHAEYLIERPFSDEKANEQALNFHTSADDIFYDAQGYHGEFYGLMRRPGIDPFREVGLDTINGLELMLREMVAPSRWRECKFGEYVRDTVRVLLPFTDYMKLVLAKRAITMELGLEGIYPCKWCGASGSAYGERVVDRAVAYIREEAQLPLAYPVLDKFDDDTFEATFMGWLEPLRIPDTSIVYADIIR